MSSSYPTQGTYIKHSDTSSPSSFAKIEKVFTINGPDGTAQPIDDTDLESTGREYIGGLADYGNVALECGFLAGTEQMKLKTMYDTGATEIFQIFVPTDATRATFQCFQFSASVSKWQLGAAVNDKQKLSVTLKVSGTVVYRGTGLT